MSLNILLKQGFYFSFYFIYFLVILGLNSGAHALPLEPLHQPYFELGILEIGAHELFALAGFKLQSS
jgi:hypothetical protein